MRSRTFTLAEIKVLVDAVQSSRFISEQQSGELIEKLSTLVGTYKGEILKRQLYIGSRVKTDNSEIAANVEKIHEAITYRRMIDFQYFDFNPQKQKILRSDGRVYRLSPISLIWNNDMYYVVGCGDYYTNKVLKYRLDRITYLNVLDEDCTEIPEDFSISDFFEKEFSMMGGKTTTVELLCENELRHGEKLYETLVTREEMLRRTDIFCNCKYKYGINHFFYNTLTKISVSDIITHAYFIFTRYI